MKMFLTFENGKNGNPVSFIDRKVVLPRFRAEVGECYFCTLEDKGRFYFAYPQIPSREDCEREGMLMEYDLNRGEVIFHRNFRFPLNKEEAEKYKIYIQMGDNHLYVDEEGNIWEKSPQYIIIPVSVNDKFDVVRVFSYYKSGEIGGNTEHPRFKEIIEKAMDFEKKSIAKNEEFQKGIEKFISDYSEFLNYKYPEVKEVKASGYYLEVTGAWFGEGVGARTRLIYKDRDKELDFTPTLVGVVYPELEGILDKHYGITISFLTDIEEFAEEGNEDCMVLLKIARGYLAKHFYKIKIFPTPDVEGFEGEYDIKYVRKEDF